MNEGCLTFGEDSVPKAMYEPLARHSVVYGVKGLERLFGSPCNEFELRSMCGQRATLRVFKPHCHVSEN